MTEVVNKRWRDYDVYIGRGSKWGNPFSHKEGTKAEYLVSSREEAIKLYSIWLHNKIRHQEITIADLLELDGKVLGCYCKPLPCHGDIIVKAIQWAKTLSKEVT